MNENNICELNNTAITLLQGGEYANALSKLRLALNLVRCRVNTDTGTTITDNEGSLQNDIATATNNNTSSAETLFENSPSEHTINYVISSVPVINDPLLCAEKDDATSPHNIFVFYGRVFKILPIVDEGDNNNTVINNALSSCSTTRRPSAAIGTNHQPSNNNPRPPQEQQEQDQQENIYRAENKVQMSLIILFNMGVIFHHHGIITGKNAMLNKAMSMYKVIISMTGNEIVPPQPSQENVAVDDSNNNNNNRDETSLSFENSHHIVKVRILLATCSNMAHIYYHSFDREEATECAYIIRRNLNLTPNLLNLLDDDDEINTFFLNSTNTDDNIKEKISYAPAA